MPLNDLELKRCETALAKFIAQRRPPPHLREQLDIGWRISNQSIEIFELRPDWRDPSKRMETPVAKMTYVRAQSRWKLYWMRRDLKWHGYEPQAPSATLDACLDTVHRDEHGCFFG